MLKAKWTDNVKYKRSDFQKSWGEKATLEKHNENTRTADHFIRPNRLLRNILITESGDIEETREVRASRGCITRRKSLNV